MWSTTEKRVTFAGKLLLAIFCVTILSNLYMLGIIAFIIISAFHSVFPILNRWLLIIPMILLGILALLYLVAGTTKKRFWLCAALSGLTLYIGNSAMLLQSFPNLIEPVVFASIGLNFFILGNAIASLLWDKGDDILRKSMEKISSVLVVLFVLIAGLYFVLNTKALDAAKNGFQYRPGLIILLPLLCLLILSLVYYVKFYIHMFKAQRALRRPLPPPEPVFSAQQPMDDWFLGGPPQGR